MSVEVCLFVCWPDLPACVSSSACELTSDLEQAVLETKKGSIFNPAMVPLALCTWLLWACSLGAEVAHSGDVHTLRTVQGVACSVCLQQSAAALLQVQTAENAVRLTLNEF